MAELNREEIIKALEWCIQSESCEYCEYNEGKADVCSIRSDALSLIKQLAEENESLKADVVPRSEVEKAKQDVAREIFEDIEKHLTFNTYGIATISNKTFAELKKKYIGE